LLWRVKDDLRLPYLELLPDGSYRSVLVKTAPQQPSRRPDRGRPPGEDLDPAPFDMMKLIFGFWDSVTPWGRCLASLGA
jgi:hypothetical protein